MRHLLNRPLGIASSRLLSRVAVATLVCASLVFSWAASASAETSTGQTLYVPCSNTTYHGPKNRPLDLTITLMVRNLDLKRSLTINSVDYHRTDGKLVRRYLDKPIVIGPLAVREFLVEQADASGGSAASFLVRWRSNVVMNAPLVEAVMISSTNSLGVSFISQGIAIKE